MLHKIHSTNPAWSETANACTPIEVIREVHLGVVLILIGKEKCNWTIQGLCHFGQAIR